MNINKRPSLTERRLKRANELLRRFYNEIEMSHLNDHKLLPWYCDSFKIKRSLGEDIYNHLQNDEVFQKTVLQRQKRYRLVKKKTEKYNKEHGIK